MTFAARLGLTKTEARIVAALIEASPGSIGATQISAKCLIHAYVDPQTVKVHMVKIRRKLPACGATVKCLHGGYSIAEGDAARLKGMGE
jgi:DNA-binding response OmpR family regulator